MVRGRLGSGQDRLGPIREPASGCLWQVRGGQEWPSAARGGQDPARIIDERQLAVRGRPEPMRSRPEASLSWPGACREPARIRRERPGVFRAG